ncbi:hypothetical protein AC579_10498 [Pseudocercospora musae]|uniref:Sec39 domain-containing protein n=1 Tax=Pseudocercospora musae TaxID=113226 RepID=A0A139IBD6_9PEZI|nr:hypothetical protein AC579_10498 [Pseudocercospora musae]
MHYTDLTQAQCVLLAVHLASQSNVRALHSFTPNRPDALHPELVLRILLTYLPEAVDPRDYLAYVAEVASRLYLDVHREHVQVDTTPVKHVPDDIAQKRVAKLHLHHLHPPAFPPHAPNDLAVRFVCHRAHRIDSETGLLHLVPSLVEPFLDRHDYLRTWYVAVCLPLVRMHIDYYPEDDALAMSLRDFENLTGRDGVDVLLSKSLRAQEHSNSHICRDVKGLVGPWMYGHTDRKRRKLGHNENGESDPVESATEAVRKIGLVGVKAEDRTEHDWEYVYSWMVLHAADRFDLISALVDAWDGPGDVDLGGFERGSNRTYLPEDIQTKLELQYAQAAFAACYAAKADTPATVEQAHAVLARLAELLDFIPPPDLATSVDSLPKIERHAILLDQSQSVADLLPEALLRPEHPLTTPKLATYMLLQMMVYSAYQFAGLGYPFSLVNVAKLHFYATSEEQLDVLLKILRGLVKPGERRDDTQWLADRAKLLWLWNWGIEQDPDHPGEGPGILGKIRKEEFEQEMLKVFTRNGNYQLAARLYLTNDTRESLSAEKVEHAVLAIAMDSLLAFEPYFKQSLRFQQAKALVAATHALSYYSLTLQHGVPFQPVSIRVSKDPLSLISKVLEQNPRSFDKLEDLIGIARNLVSAGLTESEGVAHELDADQLVVDQKNAERRVTFMAIQQALAEDDFETAYSYIVNRLTPSGDVLEKPPNRKDHKRDKSTRSQNTLDSDDISWRAAFLAGRYRPQTSTPPTLRRLEQRTELLSLALLLAPTSALTEILAAWRRCEEETTSLQAAQQQEEAEFDDRADKRLSGGSSALPGNFVVSGEQPELIMNQKRREMGRMGAARNGKDDTPLSMFDLTRSAARAFSKTAASLQTVPQQRSSDEFNRSMEESTSSLGSDERMRKRDMVANAVTGGLASGIGWVLGVTPANGQQPHAQDR